MELPSEIRVPAKRRRHPPQFKAQVLEETRQPGVSVAAVARRHNLNANLIHKWRETARSKPVATQPAPSFIPLSAPAKPGTPCQADVRIEVPCNQRVVTILWPGDQLQSLGQFIRSLS